MPTTTTKVAVNLRLGDRVQVAPGDVRTVKGLAFTDNPVDSDGATGLRISWFEVDHTNVVAVDKDMTIVGDEG